MREVGKKDRERKRGKRKKEKKEKCLSTIKNTFNQSQGMVSITV